MSKSTEKQADLAPLTPDPSPVPSVYTFDDERPAHLRKPGRKTQLVRYTKGALVEDLEHVQTLIDAGYRIVEGDSRRGMTAETVTPDSASSKRGK